eukprot:452801_1
MSTRKMSKSCNRWISALCVITFLLMPYSCNAFQSVRSKLIRNNDYINYYDGYDDGTLWDELDRYFQLLKAYTSINNQYKTRSNYFGSRFTDYSDYSDYFDYSEMAPRSIVDAITYWERLSTLFSSGSGRFSHIRLIGDIRTSTVNRQTILDGTPLEFKWGSMWTRGHFTLSPADLSSDRVGQCVSAHVTITTTRHEGNYFFKPNFDMEEWLPSNAPREFESRRNSHSGRDLPEELREEVQNFLKMLLFG